MNVFSAKSIGLYSLAIGGSILFFQLVTSYGEAKIKAPIAITGLYRLTASTLPGCLQGKQLLLNLQQSGRYLNASPIEDRSTSILAQSGLKTVRDSRPALSGQLQDRVVELHGRLPTEICPQQSVLRIIGTFTDQKIHGKLWLDRLDPSGNLLSPNPITFTGIAQSTSSVKKAH